MFYSLDSGQLELLRQITAPHQSTVFPFQETRRDGTVRAEATLEEITFPHCVQIDGSLTLQRGEPAGTIDPLIVCRDRQIIFKRAGWLCRQRTGAGVKLKQVLLRNP